MPDNTPAPSPNETLVVVPEIGTVAFPADMSPADIHSAIMDHIQVAQPTADGALENSPAFRKAASNAVAASRNYQAPLEAGFQMDKNGTPGPVQTSEGQTGDTAHNIQMAASRGSMASLHTHNAKTGSDQPSPQDIKSAKALHKTVYVSSRAGLFAVDPAGKVSQVFNRADWASKK